MKKADLAFSESNPFFESHLDEVIYRIAVGHSSQVQGGLQCIGNFFTMVDFTLKLQVGLFELG